MDAERNFDNLCDFIDIDKMSNSKEPAPENMIHVEGEDKKMFLYGGISLLKSIIGLPKEIPLFQYLNPHGPDQRFEKIFPVNKEEPSIAKKPDEKLNDDGFYALINGVNLEIVYRTFPENNAQEQQNLKKTFFFIGKIKNGHFLPSLSPSEKSSLHSHVRFSISPNGKHLLFCLFKEIKIYNIYATNDGISLIPFYHASLPMDCSSAFFGFHLSIGEQGETILTWKTNEGVETCVCNPPKSNDYPFREKIIFELLAGCLKYANENKANNLINLTNFIVEHDLIDEDMFQYLKGHMAVKLHVLTILEKISKQSFRKQYGYCGYSYYSPICPMDSYVSSLTHGKDDKIKIIIWKIALMFYGANHRAFYRIQLSDEDWDLLINSFDSKTIVELMGKFNLEPKKITL
jgi:hypothetical protein